jgi:hypothetical protein
MITKGREVAGLSPAPKNIVLDATEFLLALGESAIMTTAVTLQPDASSAPLYHSIK